jgi:hypothetical protein
MSLSGTLRFETADGSFTLRPGDVLFTEDTGGTGHNWTMTDEAPWQRLYAVLEPDAEVPFRSERRRAGGATTMQGETR